MMTLLTPSAANKEFGYSVQERGTASMTSIEAVDGNGKVFSFQVALRDIAIEAPVASPWGRFPIETPADMVPRRLCRQRGRGRIR